MANTYAQLYAQIIFSVQGNENLIKESFLDELEKVICGIVTNHKSKAYAIYCNPDHTHILVGIHPSLSVSKLTEQIKSGSSKWLNKKNFIAGKFSWQNGYGAFTYSRLLVDRIVKYIMGQPEHHKRQSFKEEYLSILKNFDVEYDDKYLFEWYR